VVVGGTVLVVDEVVEGDPPPVEFGATAAATVVRVLELLV
jgi:hypothetical protein